MSIMSATEPSLAALQDDMAALRRDLAGLMDNIRTGAAASAQSAAGQIDAGARRLYRDVASEGQQSAKALGRQIEQQPVAALLIAAGLGFLGGRLLSR